MAVGKALGIASWVSAVVVLCSSHFDNRRCDDGTGDRFLLRLRRRLRDFLRFSLRFLLRSSEPDEFPRLRLRSGLSHFMRCFQSDAFGDGLLALVFLLRSEDFLPLLPSPMTRTLIVQACTYRAGYHHQPAMQPSSAAMG